MSSRPTADASRLTSALTGASVVLGIAREATDAVPIVKQVLGAALRIVALADKMDNDRKALHALSDSSFQLARQITAVMAGKTPNVGVQASLERILKALEDIEKFMKEHATRSRLRRIISHAFSVPQHVKRLSGDLADAVQDLTVTALLSVDNQVLEAHSAVEDNARFEGEFRFLWHRGVQNLERVLDSEDAEDEKPVARYHRAEVDGTLFVVRYFERSISQHSSSVQTGEDRIFNHIAYRESILEKLSTVQRSHPNVARAFGWSRGSGRDPFTVFKSLILQIDTRLAGHYSDPSIDTAGFRFPFQFKSQNVEITARKIAPLAHGSSCKVILAFFTLNQTTHDVALKVLYDPPADQTQLMRREVELWSMTNHPHVLPYYGTCLVDNGQIAIVTPFMENGNLRQYLATNHSADRLALVQQVADGLEYLHDHARIVHGDLKCENVLIASDGSALISDFGLSTWVDAGLTVTPFELRMHHTLRFAAPELLLDQAVNEGALDRPRSKTTASDVYAFGMLVYQACTGSLPWRDVSDMGVCLNIVQGPLPERPADATLLNDALWELCEQCWSREPSARPRIGYIRERL